MMQSEFEKLIGKRIESDDYRVIEYVYMNHPVIDDVKGKQQMADLYKIGGMSIIKDMVKTAKLAASIERKIRDLESEYNALKGELAYLRDGDWKVELDDGDWLVKLDEA